MEIKKEPCLKHGSLNRLSTGCPIDMLKLYSARLNPLSEVTLGMVG